jgi:phosphoribosylglycinamide formyltransferase-1
MIVFFGEGGSNAYNFVLSGLPVKAAITNKSNSAAIKVLRDLNIPVYVINKETDIDNIISEIDHKLIVLAGYLRILPKKITDKYNIINMHPSLLPKYKGLSAFERSFRDKKAMGITLHWVNEKLDSGAIIDQIELDYFGLNIEEAKMLLKFNEYTKIPYIIKSVYDNLKD